MPRTQQPEYDQGWSMACMLPAQQQSLFITFGIKTSKINVFSFWTPHLQTKHNVLYIFLFEINSRENANNQKKKKNLEFETWAAQIKQVL